MEFHWLADILFVGAVLLFAKLVAAFSRRNSSSSEPGMRRSRLLAALEGSRTGAWVWELSSGHFLCDSRACQNLGAPAGTVLTREDFLLRLAPSDRERVEHQLQRAAESDQPFTLTARALPVDGAERYVQLNGQPEMDQRGVAVRMSGALRDITQERSRNLEIRRQAQILNQVHDAIFAASLDGYISSWNAGARQIYGYETAEAVGRKIEMLWFPEDVPGLQERISETTLASGAHEFVSRVRHKSGSELYAHFRLAVLRDGDYSAIGLLACSHDVTKQREEHETLTLQASALESIDDAVLVIDKLETILHANEGASTLYGRSADAFAGSKISSLLYGAPEEQAIRMEEIRAALASEKRWSGELLCRGADLSDPVVTRTSITLLDLSSGPNWVWVQHDISAQRRAEAALRERERRFRNLADSAPMMVWMTDASGASEYVNQAWLAHSRLAPGQACGFGWRDAIHPEDRAELARLIDCRDSERGPFEMELRIDAGGGKWTYTLTRGAPRYEAGKLVGFVGTAIDISNIKRAEQERILLEQQALKAQKLHSLGVMAGGIAHDFNNLLVSILGFSDLALSELDRRHPARSLVEQIELGSRRAASLVEQVLTFAGKAKRGEEAVDVNAAVHETVRLIERTLGDGVRVELELARSLPALIGDPAQIGQVVMNLILNSADAMGRQGGRIRIRTSRRAIRAGEAHGWIGGDNLPPGDYAHIEIHDEGCGMDETTLAQVFDPFFTTKFEGRGLGLSAVMGVVRGHSGAIRVESRPGEGSSFHVVFPLAAAAIGARARTPKCVEGEPCVLIVDDDESVLRVIRQMLRSCGLWVVCAQDEAEAVRAFAERSDSIQLVLLDVVMPDTTPARLGRRLLAIRSDVRILLSSGFAESGRCPPIDGHTFVGFVRKPYDRTQLLQAVAEACPEMFPDAGAEPVSA